MPKLNLDLRGLTSAAAYGHQSRFFRFAANSLSVALVLCAALVAFYPVVGKRSWLLFEEDDFFYYLKVAVNLSRGLGSTFNGIVSTNGYHPLWLAVMTAAKFSFRTDQWVGVFLCALEFLSTVITFSLARRLLRHHIADGLLAAALASYIALYSMHLFTGGMEVVLTIPLILTMALMFQKPDLWQPRFLPSFTFGIVLSALFLSRLDTALIIGLLGLGTILNSQLRKQVTSIQIAGIASGLVPGALYILSNRIFFDTWLTVSGAAKQLKPTHTLTLAAWHSLFGKTHAQLVNLLPILAAIILLPFVFRLLTAAQRSIYPVLLIFPFVYLFVLSCLSDWRLWDWYFYCLRPSLLVSFLLFLVWSPTRYLLAMPVVTALVALLVSADMVTSRRTTGGAVDMYSAATYVQSFAATHPGIYAMGDRSGVVGYLLPYPLVQTEGLVMDRTFLSLIRHRTPLEVALAHYHVRYYIATSRAPYTGCFHAVEPYQAGPASPHMVADLCQAPVGTFAAAGEQSETLIFDLAAGRSTR